MRRTKKLLLVLLAVAGGVFLRERRTAAQIQVATPPVDPIPRPRPAHNTAEPETEDAPAEDDLSQPFAVAPAGPGDDLKKITGIGPKLESMLHDQGITTFQQLAALTDADVDRLEARLQQFPGRIRRDDWVAQAKQQLADD